MTNLKKVKQFLTTYEQGDPIEEIKKWFWEKGRPRWLRIIITVSLIIVSIFFLYVYLPELGDKIRHKIWPTPIPISKPEMALPESSDQIKAMETHKDPCNTSNNFESNIWKKKGNFQIITTNPDTGEAEYLGAKREKPYQSQMIYPYDCSLPLVATISAKIRSPESIGLNHEYQGVVQTILGDGDRRAIRYKIDTEGTRKAGWEYLRDEDDKIITHWLPADVTIGSQLDLTVKLEKEKENILKLTTTIEYLPIKSDKYKTIPFPPVIFKVDSFNADKNSGRQTRVGINDEKFQGEQSQIQFLKFSINSTK